MENTQVAHGSGTSDLSQSWSRAPTPIVRKLNIAKRWNIWRVRLDQPSLTFKKHLTEYILTYDISTKFAKGAVKCFQHSSLQGAATRDGPTASKK